MEFQLLEFNPRRWARHAAAARVVCLNPDGTTDLLWMSKSDIRKNIEAFGESEALTKALDCYQRPGQFYPPRDDATLAAEGQAIHRAAEQAIRTGTGALLIDPAAVSARLVSDYLGMP